MNSFAFFINISTGIAGLFLLPVFVFIMKSWIKARWLKQNGTETEARILQMEVMNERGRCIAFVKLKVAVITEKETTFIASVASFFHPSELPELTPDGIISVRYNPSNISQLQIIKRSQAVIKKQAPGWQPVSAKAYLSMVQ